MTFNETNSWNMRQNERLVLLKMNVIFKIQNTIEANQIENSGNFVSGCVYSPGYQVNARLTVSIYSIFKSFSFFCVLIKIQFYLYRNVLLTVTRGYNSKEISSPVFNQICADYRMLYTFCALNFSNFAMNRPIH